MNCGIRRIHTLTARAGCAANGDFQFLRLDFHVHFLRFGQHGNGAGAGVNAALRLGGRHALNTMHAALIFEPLENIRAGDRKNNFLEPAEIGRAGVHCFDLPIARLGVMRIHPVKIRSKQRGFPSTGAGADFDDGIARIRRVRR